MFPVSTLNDKKLAFCPHETNSNSGNSIAHNSFHNLCVKMHAIQKMLKEKQDHSIDLVVVCLLTNMKQ